MIIADSNVLIDFLRHPTEEGFKMFIDEGVAVCGAVTAELLHGSRSDKEVRDIQELVSYLKYIDMARDDWEQLGFFLRKLRERGLAVPMADAIISYLAIKQDIEVWTRDGHFAKIQAIVPELRLFSIEEETP